MSLKQFKRLVYFHKMIHEGQYPSSRSIREHFHVTARTAYRDIKLLRSQFMAPLEYDHIKHGYYYSKQNWDLF